MSTVNVNRETLRLLRPAIDAALAEVAQRFGLILKIGNGSFAPDGASGHLKVEIARPSASGATDPAIIKAEADWKTYARPFGLDADWLHKETVHNGTPHKILGLMPSRAKFPVLVLAPSGKQMLLTLDGVRRGMVKLPAAV